MTSARQIYLGSRRGPALPYDAQVEYLESTGTQWIVFDGSRVAANSVVGVKWQFLADVRQQRVYAFGSAYNSIYENGSGSISVAINGSYDFIRPERAWNLGPFTASIPMGQGTARLVTASGLSSTRSLSGNAILDHNGILFASTSGGIYPMKGKIWYFYVTYNGERIVDMIPVRFTNELGQSEGAMYDRVSGQLSRNAGTGVFVFGTDIAGGGYKWLGYSPLRFSRSTRLWKEAA